MMALPLKAIEPAAASSKPDVNLDLTLLVKSQPPARLDGDRRLQRNRAL
ncbi:MAG: hypothetical protein RL706_583 [Pseudomonadota bacterium]|jgi:hypothetical protein